MGLWQELEPLNLSKKHKGHPWVFATYIDFPSLRDDHSWYEVFLFRNSDWSVFGIKEFLSPDHPVHHESLRRLATKVITDKDFRQSLVSDDPDLPRWWKRH